MNFAALATHIQHIERSGGLVCVYHIKAPPLFVVEASGYIGPTILRDVLALAEIYGRAHPDGWDYLVDPRQVSLAHPLNLIWFRKIHGLPNLRRYLALAPSSLILRLLASAVARLSGPDMIIYSPKDLARLYDLT
jgi:hypothetical protein